MATKKQNRRHQVRRLRRVLNSGKDVGKQISGHRLHTHGYHSGISRAKATEKVEKE